MAPVSFFLLGFGLLFLRSSSAQLSIASPSTYSAADPQNNSLPPPTKQTFDFWTSVSPRGGSDVPVRTIIKDQRMTHPTARSLRSSTSASSAKNRSSGTVLTQTTASGVRTDTTSSAASRALTKNHASAKGPTPPLPTLTTVNKPVRTPDPQEEDSQDVGSGGSPTGTLVVPVATVGDEMAQRRPQTQTVVSVAATSPRGGPSPKPPVAVPTAGGKSSTTAEAETRVSAAPVLTHTVARTGVSTGELTANTPSTVRDSPEQDSAAAATAAAAPTTTTTSGESPAPALTVTAQSQKSSPSNATTTHVTTTSATSGHTTSREALNISPDAANVPTKTTQRGRSAAISPTVALSRSGTTSFLSTGFVSVTRPRFGPTYQTGIGQRNRSVLLGHPHQVPHSTTNPTPSPPPAPTGPLLDWGDLSRTLAFAWGLHVYGSATLFLLLFAGAALGLTLSPGINCPHRGAVALANALLFVTGGLRAALFLIDPYGTRKLLPRTAVMALYNLPLHLLVWTHAAVALLALRLAGVSVLPSTVERPPLVAVLAVLQCTLLLAADLLSPALSPVVPVTLQVLSLCWGLALCLGFLFYVFPRTRCPSAPHPGAPEEGRRKPWTGNRRIGIVLGRVLAVCAVLGTVCCGLHIHATLWLYGLLGDWTRFSWGWWLVHFWARLLELSWGFSLLLLCSWVFWRSQGCQGREEGGADGRSAGDLPSPGQSTGSAQRHTCWSKIVQSLKGKPCRKSESNGVVGGGGGGGGGTGEVPNNWAGQERPGADISKSLIRNQNPEQAAVLPRYVKDSNRGRNHRGQSAERGVSDGSAGSLLRLQSLGRPPQRSASGSLDHEKDTSLSFCEFDLRPPSPIDLTRSIDEALHREHLLEGGSLFHPTNQISLTPSPGSGMSQGPWLRRNSDPQLSDSSEAPTESSMPLGGSVLSSVPSRQVTAPPTPSHQGHRWGGNAAGSVPSSVSCPVSFRPLRVSTGHLEEDGVEDTRPFITPDSERGRGRGGRPAGSRSYLEVSRHEDSASVSSDIVDL